MLQPVSMKQLLEAGVHFGHQKRRWNPKMAKYIYTDRNDIYIVDLKKTLKLLRESCLFVRDTVAAGGRGIFVGTKKQAREAVEHWAMQCGMSYVNNRWLGGVLTNWATMSKNTKHLLDLERQKDAGEFDKYSKKMQSRLNRELGSLKKNLDGLKHMKTRPDFMFVIDPDKEHIAVAEANKLGIPVVGVVDTNCNPDPIDYVIPGNDDAIRAINLVCQKIAESCIDGMLTRVESGLEDPSILPESIRQQVLGLSPAEGVAPAPVQEPAAVVAVAPVAEVEAPRPAPAPVPQPLMAEPPRPEAPTIG